MGTVIPSFILDDWATYLRTRLFATRAGRNGFSRRPGYWVHCLKLSALLILVNTYCRLQSAHAIAFVVLPSRRLSYVLISRAICIFCLRVLQLTVLDVLSDIVFIMCVCWFVGLFLYSGHVLYFVYISMTGYQILNSALISWSLFWILLFRLGFIQFFLKFFVAVHC